MPWFALQAMTDGDLRALYRFIKSMANVEQTSSSALPGDFGAYARLDEQASSMDGAGWLEFVQCCKVTGGEGILITGYPRFQLQMQKKAGADGASYMVTPTKRKAGEDPIGKRLRQILTAEGWEAVKRTMQQSEIAAGGKVSLKVGLHHIAYSAKQAANPSLPLLPYGTGTGSSISHLCDNKHCINKRHLEVAAQHIQNLERQRCKGAILLVLDGVIMQTVYCPHYASGDDVDEEGNIISLHSQIARAALLSTWMRLPSVPLRRQQPSSKRRMMHMWPSCGSEPELNLHVKLSNACPCSERSYGVTVFSMPRQCEVRSTCCARFDGG